MRLYGGRTIRNQLRRQLDERQELRDAIVFDVNTTLRYCRVKIQGSDTHVKAYYNENWEATPQWLKPGNAVRVSLPGGNKARIEVVGHGFLLPTAVAGGTGSPTPAVPGDAVLTGGTLAPVSPAAMQAEVSAGTVRIDGVTYSFAADTVSFDASSASYFRYDAVVVGADGTLDVVKGSNAASDPVMPSVTADHALVGWVLIYKNMTTVTAADIGRLYTAPTPVELRVVTDDQDLAWGDTSTTITISVMDQYGNTITEGSPGYEVTMAWDVGNGELSYGGDTQDESASFTFYMASSAAVTYTRGGNDPGDSSPTFSISESVTGLTGATYVMLWNSSSPSGIMF